MDSERYQKIKRIFNEAVDLAPAEREDFLARSCEDSPTLRGEVERMLEFAVETGAASDDALEKGAFDVFTNGRHTKIPEKIGDYEIVREIGRGGMGAVYEAVRRTADFTQRVALKIIKRGMDTDAILSRFRHEQRILSSLEHVGIARFLDGGMTDAGLPFYAMEYVEGEFIDEYCRRRELSVEKRLELFRQVCAAVQYAHQNLVIHRDLKPSNILVTADGTPKLLDFGIGKVLTPETDEEIGTATELGMMTPAYASPEQIRGERIGTASDIYSLGVILYELLTGQRPYRLRSKNRAEIENAILESEPVRPSAISNSRFQIPDSGGEIPDSRFQIPDSKTESQKTKAEAPQANSTKSGIWNLEFGIQRNRKSQIANRKSLRGDLDTIALKALRKEPNARYVSAQEFSEDIRRFLVGLPITARPATFFYRASKFVRRNRVGVTAAAFVFLSLCTGIALAVWQAARAEREKTLAEKRFAEVRQIANNVVFKYTDAITNLPNSSEVREMLLKDASAYLDNLAQDARDDVELQRELAAAYVKLSDLQGAPYGASLGSVEKAIENMRKAILIEEAILRQNPADKEEKRRIAQIYNKFGNLIYVNGDAEETEATYRKAETLLGELLTEEPENTDLLVQLVRLQIQMGSFASESRLEMEKARASVQQASANVDKLLALKPDDAAVNSLAAAVNTRLAMLLGHPEFSERDDLPAASEKIQKALAIRRKLSAADPANLNHRRQYAIGLIYQADILTEQGKPDDALALYGEAQKLTEDLYKRDRNDFFSRGGVALVLSKTGRALAQKGQFAEGFQKLREAGQRQEEFLAERKTDASVKNTYLMHLLGFGEILTERRQYEEAEKILLRAREIQTEIAAEAKGFKILEINDAAVAAALGVLQSQSGRNLFEAKANLERGLITFRDLKQRGVLLVRFKNLSEQAETELQKLAN